MKSLLERSRLLHTILQCIDKNINYLQEMAVNLATIFECDDMIIGVDGQIVGRAKYRPELTTCVDSEQLFITYGKNPLQYHKNFLALNETAANLSVKEAAASFLDMDFPGASKEIWSVIPVYSGVERMATLIMCRYLRGFTEEELTLTEYGALVVAREVLKIKAEGVESDGRKRVAVQAALDSLSYSEREAIDCIFRKLSGVEGNLVASKIADEIGITRSVIVSALRKFESARIIQSKSLGMKGTYIKVLNEFLFSELNIPR
jgi:transcriptional pleiotropic repressor